MKHPTSSLEILTIPYGFAVGFCTIFPWNWSDWSDLILPRPWINHCVGAAMWGIFWVGAWTILEPIGVAIFVPSGPSARNFLVFLSVQTFPSYLAGSNSCCWYPQCSWVYQDDLWTEVPGDQSAWSGASLPLGISGVELPQLEDVCQSSYVPWSNGGLYIP